MQIGTQQPRLPYAPLPQAAIQAATKGIVQLGFDEKGIVRDYKFSSTNNNVIKMNALAFAHSSQRDLDDYAGITVINAKSGYSDEEIVKALAESSAVVHLIHREDSFSFWTSNVYFDEQKKNKTNKASIKPILIEKAVTYERLGEMLRAYSDDLHPDHIIHAKQGNYVFKQLPQVNSLQLSFWAEEIRSKPLVQYFERAINILRTHPSQISNDRVTTVATQLLALLILADTGVFGEQIRQEREQIALPALITQAHSQFPHFFDTSLLLNRHFNAVEQAYTMLQRIQYAGFVPDMLGNLYAVAYEPKVRKHLGNYDTPLYITRHILNAIPIEYLPPHERIIADVTCGWGSFLIAGNERLSDLSDAKEISIQQSLYGNDYDVFFTQLAKLGLLHTTHKDDWAISHADIFQWQWLKDNQPNIIVGNPPFEGNRKLSAQVETDEDIFDTMGDEEEHKRVEKANKFLEYALSRLKPGGYLALIMPRSFTVSESGQDTRQKLLEVCDIFELWDLPTQVFKGATQRTTVIFARKMRECGSSSLSSACVRTRTVQPATLYSLKDRGIYTASELSIDQSKWYHTEWKNEHGQNIKNIIDYTIILSEASWQKIKNYCVDLQYCVDRTRGLIKGTKRKNRGRQSKNIDLLPDVRHCMPYSHVINYRDAQEARYPDDFERPRLNYEELLRGPKVVLQYIQTPSWGKRVKIAIENRGYYVSDNFWAIAPKKVGTLWLSYTLTNEILAAILEWHISNAWIIEHMKSPGIPSHAIDTIPIPTDLSQSDCMQLTEAVFILEKEAQAGSNTSPLTYQAQETINTILKAAYHLDDDTFQRLRWIMEWDSNPYTTLDAQPDLSKANWLTSGMVDHVDAGKGTITFWFNGFDDLQTVRIMPSMPGWMLRSGTSFLVRFSREYRRQRKIDFENIHWGHFQPQPYMYMNQEELLDAFSQNFVTKPQ